jgi:hypothetical protein
LPPLWFDYMLAEKLGLTVRALRETMSASELIWWAAYRARIAELEGDAQRAAESKARR